MNTILSDFNTNGKLSVYNYNILGVSLYIILEKEQIEFFNKFIERLLSMEDWKYSKKCLAIDFLREKAVYENFDNYIKNIPEWSWDDVIKNSLSSINNTLDKLEPFYIEKYKSHKRDIKIVDILKD